jgi:telomere length regulation protein
MDELLRPISSTYVKSENAAGPLLQKVQASSRTASTPKLKPKSLQDVAEALSNEPDYDNLVSALEFITHGGPEVENFNIGAPGPEAARIIQILVTEIVPNYWAILKESSSGGQCSHLSLLLDSLRNLAGINATLLRLRTLTQEHKSQAEGVQRSGVALNLKIALELLCAILEGDGTIQSLWANTSVKPDSAKQRILSKEFANIIAGGRIISFSAEAGSVLAQQTMGKVLWVADGLSYSQWLARNIISWSKRVEIPVERDLVADLLSKALRLGYSGALSTLLLSDQDLC